MMIHLFNVAIVLAAAMQGVAMNRLDETFTTGPETLVAQAQTILVGSISQYTKQVEEQSQGSAPIPVRWTISAKLEHVEALKGNAPKQPLDFRREERSPFLPATVHVPTWQAELGHIQPDDRVVVFLGNKSGEILVVLPSGKQERDLVALIRLIVPIQGLGSGENAQAIAWEKHLHDAGASSTASRRVALRSLMKLTRNWIDVEATLRLVMSGKDADSRRYAFGLVAFEIVHEKWSETAGPAEFLCTQLAGEMDAEIAQSHREHVDLVRQFALDEDFREQRKPLLDRLRGCTRHPRPVRRP
jgi:hypothetical protein